MNSFRLKRLFHPRSGRCFNVAIDHGFFNEHGFLTGIEDINAAIRTVADAHPDAIQLTVGQARHLRLSQAGSNRHLCSGSTWQTFTEKNCHVGSIVE